MLHESSLVNYQKQKKVFESRSITELYQTYVSLRMKSRETNQFFFYKTPWSNNLQLQGHSNLQLDLVISFKYVSNVTLAKYVYGQMY